MIGVVNFKILKMIDLYFYMLGGVINIFFKVQKIIFLLFFFYKCIEYLLCLLFLYFVFYLDQNLNQREVRGFI